MDFKIAILWTDTLIYVLVGLLLVFLVWARKQEHIKQSWQQVMQKPLAVSALLVLMFYSSIGLLDSLHFRPALPGTENSQQTHYSVQMRSVLDVLLAPIGDNDEKTYSAPFAKQLYSKETVTNDEGKQVRLFPHLMHIGSNSVTSLSLQGMAYGSVIFLILTLPCLIISAKRHQVSLAKQINSIARGKTKFPWRSCMLTLACIVILSSIVLCLAQEFHVLGTNKVGQDVFYLAIKSVRTGLVIGTLTTLFMLPLALLFGTMAGYFGGWVDDIIQYVYTTLSSIPGVLLIAAVVLSLQVFISTHAEIFPTLASRADARLLALCLILGVTSWTGLCRLLRGETLKLREVDYVQAAKALGVSRFATIVRHIVPNVLHIVLITIALDFSGLVLAEAVLSYVGVGVDPSAISWGNMINSARLELARDPIVWWPLCAAFIFMFTLVLAANLFADAVRDAFDPRLRQH